MHASERVLFARPNRRAPYSGWRFERTAFAHRLAVTDRLRPVHARPHAFAIPAFAQNRLTPTSDAPTTTAQRLLAEHGDCKAHGAAGYIPTMGFNKRKMEDACRQEAEKEAAARRATDRQILEDAEQLVTAWNERQAKRMPMLFSPTIGAAITAGYWFLRARWGRTRRVDLRHSTGTRPRTPPALSCRSCRPNAPFAELVCLSKSSVAEEYYAERPQSQRCLSGLSACWSHGFIIELLMLRPIPPPWSLVHPP